MNVTQMLYDGLNPVQELDGGNAVTANLLTGLGIDEYFARTDSSGTMAFMRDALGSTVGLVGAASSIDTGYTYQPFGATTVAGSNANPYQFTGRENDGTGLYFYRARYYSPTFQRFIAQDPFGFAGGGSNLYEYVVNDPTDITDPKGNQLVTALLVGAAIGGVVGAVNGIATACSWSSVTDSALIGAGIGAGVGVASILGASGALGSAIGGLFGARFSPAAAGALGGSIIGAFAATSGTIANEEISGSGLNGGAIAGSAFGGALGGSVAGAATAGLTGAANITVGGSTGLSFGGLSGGFNAVFSGGKNCGCGGGL
jgi:RHS repeat-associated protein